MLYYFYMTDRHQAFADKHEAIMKERTNILNDKKVN